MEEAGSRQEAASDRQFNRIVQDVSGRPVVDPYAAAARRADAGETVLPAGGRGRGRGTMAEMNRKPLPQGGVRMERGAWVENTGP